MEIEFSGGHLAGSTQALADQGLIKIISKRQLPTGCWEYKIKNMFTGVEFYKTEFHISWTKEMILQYAWDLFENMEIQQYLAEDGKLAKYIKIEACDLSIAIKNHEKDINIVTIVPYEIEKKIV